MHPFFLSNLVCTFEKLLSSCDFFIFNGLTTNSEKVHNPIFKTVFENIEDENCIFCHEHF
jgi:hypothetical protein